MKSISLLLAAFFLSCFTVPQHTVQIRNLWEKPQVHVLFEGYTISFTIKDINKALQLLAETGDSTYGLESPFDTNKNYNFELYPGTRMEYHTQVQPMLQNGVGAFLLTAGHAEIRNEKQKKTERDYCKHRRPYSGCR